MARSLVNDMSAVIARGNYDLADILSRIDVLFVAGRFTAEERDALVQAARENAQPSYAPYDERLSLVEEKCADFEARLAALENGGTAPEQEEYPPWHDVHNAEDAYYTGMKMTYTDGKRYINISPEGYGCCYGPDVLPGHWQLVEDETEQGRE